MDRLIVGVPRQNLRSGERDSAVSWVQSTCSIPMSPATSATAIEDSVAPAYARWRAMVDAELKGAVFDKKLVTRTFDGPALQPLYTRASVAGVCDLETKPGAAPYLRGVRPLGYKSRGWEV